MNNRGNSMRIMARHNILALCASGMAMVAGLSWSGPAQAECPALPNSISNGQPADASKVMGDFNHLRDCLNGDVGTISSPSVSLRSPSGPAVTIKAPSVTTAYDLNLPVDAGVSGQVLTSSGPGQPTRWSSGGGGGAAPIDGVPVLRPTMSSLSWLNQGTATAVDHTGGPITMIVPGHASYQLKGLQMAPPSADFTTTAKLDCSVVMQDSFCGVHVLDSANKLMFFGISYSSLVLGYAASPTSAFNIARSVNINAMPRWFRVSRTASNWTVSWSMNGADWITFSNGSYSSYVGATITGSGALGTNYSTGSANDTTMSIWSLEVKAGAGTNSHW